MDLTVDQAAFSRALRLVGRAVPARPKLPVLQHVLLEGAPGRLTLTATDLDLAIVTGVDAAVGAPGPELPSEPLRLALDPAGRRVRATCGAFAASFAAADPGQFPTPPSAEGAVATDVDAPRLRAAIGRVAFAAARDEQRPVLAAVLLDFGPEGLTLAAADGFRLARVRLPGASAEPRQLLVPARAVAELGRLLGDAGTARIVVPRENRGVQFLVGATTLSSRLVEGRFPDVERVVPGAPTTRLSVEAAAFRRAVRVAGLFGADASARPAVLEPRGETLRLRARGAETGDAEAELGAASEGPAQPVVLDTRLLVEILDAVDGPRLELGWSTAQSPVVLREQGAGDADLWVLMPLHDPALVAPSAPQQAA
jgi:DNA polymerase-3 subunit beta